MGDARDGYSMLWTRWALAWDEVPGERSNCHFPRLPTGPPCSVYARLESNPRTRSLSDATDLLDVILAGGFVRRFEEAGGVFAEPLGQLVEFFAEAVDGLLVHVRLGDEFGQGD